MDGPSSMELRRYQLNPADCASRGLLPSELLNHPLWTKGPRIEELNCSQSVSLSTEQRTTFEESVKKNSLVLHSRSCNGFELLTKFSSHSKLIRIMTVITVFLRKSILKILQRLDLDEASPLRDHLQKTLDNLETPENVIFRVLQHENYTEEISKLRANTDLKTDSKLRGLHPFLGAFGILRVGGRLQNAELSFNQRHPIILPIKHQIVTNLIAEAHAKTFHGTENLTQAYLRHRFHIPRMSEKVRNFIHGCMKCFKFAKQQQETLMGSLPVDRVNLAHPFEHAGVDYAGPIITKAYPGRCKKYLKSYIAVFVCLCTKAIHIEVVSDLKSQSFLAAFKRFTGRRGRCQRLYSDNGTNFVGANNLLQQDLRLAEQTWKSDLEFDFQQLNTEWRFIPPASPHFGGLWEAGVKSIKNHMKKTIGTSLLTFEELTTLLVQIEAVLNSRPLCPLTNNPNEYNCLTPGHFLVGRPLVAPPERLYEVDKKSPLERWHHIQALNQRFAHLWKRDYLQRLENRPKGLITKVQYKNGDLVLLTDDDTPATLWPTVIVEEIHPGKDGIVRVVTVRNHLGKCFKRPVTKLRFLPCNYSPEV